MCVLQLAGANMTAWAVLDTTVSITDAERAFQIAPVNASEIASSASMYSLESSQDGSIMALLVNMNDLPQQTYTACDFYKYLTFFLLLTQGKCTTSKSR